jgi:uncharacterized protein (DUF934 family)
MERVGFNAFEIVSDDPMTDFDIAANDFTAWYQASGDDRHPAPALRQLRRDD